MLATIQKGEAASRRDLRAQLVVERLTGIPQDDGYINAAMQRGIDKEADALAAYEAFSGCLVQRAGFLAHGELAAGVSLDGYVGDFHGIVEVKCPKSATHLNALRSRAVPTEYAPQVLHGLWMTGASWCDWVSFDDRFPERLQLLIVRVVRNQFEVMAYERTVLTFLESVDREYQEAVGLSVSSALVPAQMHAVT